MGKIIFLQGYCHAIANKKSRMAANRHAIQRNLIEVYYEHCSEK